MLLPTLSGSYNNNYPETSLITDTTPTLGGNLNGNGKEITNTSDIKSNVYGVDIRDISGVAPYLKFDQGEFHPTTFNNSLDYLVHQMVIDYDDGSSTFTEVSSLPVADMGTFSA